MQRPIRSRGGMALTVVASAVLLCLAPSAHSQEGLAGPREGETISQWSERWLDGPVSVLATAEEKRIYAELGSTQERLQFIRLFWERRDPQVRGPRNEFLDAFAERVAYAEREFTERGEPGWKTIFGRVVLLFGPPDRTRRELGLPTGFSDRPAILWGYDELHPGLEPNEDLLFVHRAGQWSLMPQSGGTSIPDAVRQAESQTMLPQIPSDYRLAMDESIEASLVNLVDYRQAIDTVRTAVRVPEVQIPFSWSARSESQDGGGYRVSVDLSWRMDSLVFHLEDGSFRTDMVVEVQLLRAGEPTAVASERIEIEVPADEMDARREEVVRRTVSLDGAAGEYEIVLALVDQILGYQTVYRNPLVVPGS